MFEDSTMSIISRENSQEFQEVPPATGEDHLYEIREWEEQQEITKTNSLHELELKTINGLRSSIESKQEYLNEDTNIDDELPLDHINKEEQHGLLHNQSDPGKTDKCTSYTSIIPHIVLSGMFSLYTILRNQVSNHLRV